MKKYVIIIFVLFLVGCQEYLQETQYVSTIVDCTDSRSSIPSSREILSYVNTSQTSDGLELSLSYVGETRYSEKLQFILPKGETGFLSNESTRRSKRKKLFKKFSNSLEKTDKSVSTRSEIFRLVAKEADCLSKLKGKRSILLFTDLKEHSSLFSIYNRSQIQRLCLTPKSVAEQFSKCIQATDLSGITIYILHQPTRKDDIIFTAMVGLYKKVFESKGAKVYVTKNHKVTI